MKYIVDVNGERVEVDVDGAHVRVGGDVVPAHIADVEGTPILLVTIGDELHRVAVRRGDSRGRYALWMDGYRYEAEALDERMRTIRDLTNATAQASGPRPLTAPMPGLIVRVQVQVGDEVQAGDAMVVMEAMKMENELRATSAGTVSKIHVTAGTAVEKGALLVEL
ncbi:MAG: biotin/lipoyl-containing protein [Gemmatimonadaceae bacterium]